MFIKMKLKIVVILAAVIWDSSAVMKGQQTSAVPSSAAAASIDRRLALPGSPLGIAWGFLYGYLGVKPERFMPPARELVLMLCWLASAACTSSAVAAGCRSETMCPLAERSPGVR